MKLDHCLENIEIQKIVGSQEIHIAHISQDTREDYVQGTLYIAVSGTVVDGHTFIDKAITKGAIAIVCQHIPNILQKDVTYIQVIDTSIVVGQIAHNFFNKPSDSLKVIGVTGTNGKTTVATYIAQCLFFLGQKPLLLSTAGDFFEDKKITITRKASSSVEVIELHRILRAYVDQGATHVCLEATSHALDQHRLSGINVDVGIFTNLTQDHLDYHGTMQRYAQAKSLLFSSLMGSAVAIINHDDTYAQQMVHECYVKQVSYGVNNTYDYFYQEVHTSADGTELIINNNPILTQVFGNFNMYNLTATYATLVELGFLESDVSQVMSAIRNTSGRLQSIDNKQGILGIVDYAHTPDALENVLDTLAEINHKRIITVVGCGGDRDKLKRPHMAKIAQAKSNLVIYTSDNPRTEPLNQIFDDMKSGINTFDNNYIFIDSREESIAYAVNRAHTGDIILVAGKGHEKYQEIGTEKVAFDDAKMLKKYLDQKSV